MWSTDLQVATVDLIDDLQVTRQQLGKQVDWPALQSFRKDGVIGVGTRAHTDVPGLNTSERDNMNHYDDAGKLTFLEYESKALEHKQSYGKCSSTVSLFLTMSHSSFSSSTRTLISSGIAMAGWVSFSWMAT